MRFVLGTGSREWDDEDMIYLALRSIALPFVLVVGEARGADKMFWRSAKKLGQARLRFDARWKDLGNRAGFERNGAMIDYISARRAEGHSAIVLAAWDGSSRGTKDTIDRARSADFEPWMITIGRSN